MHPAKLYCDEVRAVLDGHCNQIVRPIDDLPMWVSSINYDDTKNYHLVGVGLNPSIGRQDSFVAYCPLRTPSSQFWVRETFGYTFIGSSPNEMIIYRADGPEYVTHSPRKHNWGSDYRGWRSSMHMRTSDSRLSIETVSVKVCRVQSLSVEGLIRCGIEYGVPADFERTWKLRNYEHSYKSNPFVWVISFKVIDKRG